MVIGEWLLVVGGEDLVFGEHLFLFFLNVSPLTFDSGAKQNGLISTPQTYIHSKNPLRPFVAFLVTATFLHQ